MDLTPEIPKVPTTAEVAQAAPTQAAGLARLNTATLGAQNILTAAAPIAGLVLGGVIAYQGLKTIVTGEAPWPFQKKK